MDMSHVHEETIDIKFSHGILSPTGKADKAKELALLKEIISAICALLNSNGGKVVLHIQDISTGQLPSTQKMPVIKKLEQSMIAISGIHRTVWNININFKEVKEGIVIYVKKADSLITTNYHLYLPTETQIVQASSLEPRGKIKDIMKRVVPHAVQYGSHCKIFCKDEHCGFSESKSVQLKYLKADRSNRTRLADRMTGKANKFCGHVSAFANYQGGHIYYGIRDDGIAEGELVSSEEDMREITKKVEKAINKMIWPELIGQPKRGVQWDIFFEPVVDENNAIPSTFVIVVYIAPCLGGVFTEEPECYEMVEGKAKKMSFASWKRRIFQPIELLHSGEIPSSPQRITWSSTRIQRICTRANELLTQCVNNGKSIEYFSTKLEKQFPRLIEVKLVILSKKVMVCYRSFCFKKAQRLLNKYADLLIKTTESGIFDAIRAYIEVALHRAEGDVDALRVILAGALDKAEKIPPGLITAGIYLLAATVASLFQNRFQNKEDARRYSVDVLSIRALQHLQYVQDSPEVRADMEQKVHITLALSYLGCNISGQLTKPEVDSKSLERAISSVTAVNKSINEGNPMNRYRELQFNLVQSILYYRHAQIQPTREATFLREAFNFSKKAERAACVYRFEEMAQWARACMALCTESLVRTHFIYPISTDCEDEASGSSSCEDNASFPKIATKDL